MSVEYAQGIGEAIIVWSKKTSELWGRNAFIHLMMMEIRLSQHSLIELYSSPAAGFHFIDIAECRKKGLYMDIKLLSTSLGQ